MGWVKPTKENMFIGQRCSKGPNHTWVAPIDAQDIEDGPLDFYEDITVWVDDSHTPEWRKERPLARGVLDYFPDALLEVAHVSKVGNDQHNPGQEMHWAKEKSTDHADCILRHLVDRGKLDTDGLRHTAKVAWRALALLQTELDKEKNQ